MGVSELCDSKLKRNIFALMSEIRIYLFDREPQVSRPKGASVVIHSTLVVERGD